MIRSRGFPAVQYSFAFLLLVFTVAPILWMGITAVSIHRNVISIPLKIIPPEVTFKRFVDVAANPENDIAWAFKIAMGNSLIVSTATTFIALVMGSLASYAFARLN